ncbi:MAG: hypothetical protein F6K40_16295 [Okeania sp. SIO3I5]|nr:hypothetical protein [Okeania sp. SIO3I5]NEQ37739.1 hypothetical protein [Okeania sp. SIO3I5]
MITATSIIAAQPKKPSNYNICFRMSDRLWSVISYQLSVISTDRSRGVEE